MTTVCVLATLGLYVGLGRASFTRLLSPAVSDLYSDEAVLLAWTICASTSLALVPSLALGSLTARFVGRRGGYVVFALGVALTSTLLALDLLAYEGFGRHLRELLGFALVEGGAQAGGNAMQWVRPALRWLGLSSLCAVLGTLASRAVVGRLARLGTHRFWSVASTLLATVVAVGSLAPHAATAAWSHRVVVERLYEALPFDARRLGPFPGTARSDQAWQRLDSGLRHAYATRFQALSRVSHGPPRAPMAAALPRNVVLIVAESLREDAFTEERMPRLTAWSKRGLVATAHFAGSDYSEAGMFALLFGVSPLVYHAVLDAKRTVPLCDLAHRTGHDCAYYSGQPLAWRRMNEFVNRQAFDELVKDDAGTWPEWDRRALSSAVAHVERARERPTLTVVYLMSSHFDYKYPREYEKHLPVLGEEGWRTRGFNTLGAVDRPAYLNRYWNSVAFTDDVVMNAVERLDPATTVVIVTGDHGESIHDDGHYGHGQSFADIIAKVPFVAVGPGIAKATLTQPTLHVDLLPTLAHLLTGLAPPADGHGPRSLLSEAAPRRSLFLAHAGFERDVADCLLIAGDLRLRMDVDLRRRDLSLRGFEDPEGRAIERTLSSERAEDLVHAFEDELDSILRSLD
jgi:membrane-anchored protein YejM (alkaline phosphatase superfamily)